MAYHALSLAFALVSPATYFVSASGSDTDPGSQARPFATLSRALDWAAANDRIVLLPGRHRCRQVGTVSPRHRGLQIVGEPGAILTGSVAVPFRNVDADLLARLPEAARSKVRQIDLKRDRFDDVPDIEPRGFSQADRLGPFELIVDGQAQTLARWPNEGFLKVSQLLQGGDVPREKRYTGQKPRFRIESDRPSKWGRNDLWAYGYWKWDWADESLPVASISGREIELGLPHHYGVDRGRTFYFENVLEELDRPGEYWFDPAGRRIVFWTSREPSRVEISALDEPLIEIKGADNVRIENLTFEASRREAIRVQDGSELRIERCEFRNLGRYAVFVRGGRGHRIGECRFEDLAAGGIDIAAGDRKTLRPGAHRIENCRFRNYMRLCRTYRPAVLIGGVGVEVKNCEFHDAPHSAIIFSGNEHRIQGNAFYDLLGETGDGGAVYGGRDWTARGTQIIDNLFWRIRGLGMNENGVYLDDQLSGIRVERNAFIDCHWGVMVGGGRDNVVAQNVFANCRLAIHMDARGLGWAKDTLTTLKEGLDQVPYREGVWKDRYPSLVRVLSDEPMAPVGNIVVGNLLLKSGSIRDKAEAAFLQKSSVAANPEFASSLSGQYRDGRFAIGGTPSAEAKLEAAFNFFELREWKFGVPAGTAVGPSHP